MSLVTELSGASHCLRIESWHKQMLSVQRRCCVARGSAVAPHQELLGGGFSTLGPLFCLICTIISTKTGLFDSYQNPLQVLAARSFLVARFDNRWAIRRVSCGVDECMAQHETHSHVT